MIYVVIGFASVLLRIFPSMFIGDIRLYFAVVSLPGFGVKIMLASQKGLEMLL